jgi:hypothetical protein
VLAAIAEEVERFLEAERAQHADSAYSEAANRPRFSGKDFQVVDVVARWILTGTAPDEIR